MKLFKCNSLNILSEAHVLPDELGGVLGNDEYVGLSGNLDCYLEEELELESTDCHECMVSSYGVLLKGIISDTDIFVESHHFTWEEIIEMSRRPRSIEYLEGLKSCKDGES